MLGGKSPPDVLFDVITSGDLAGVKRYLRFSPYFDINLPGDQGLNALHKACANGLTSIVQILLAHPEIDVNVKDLRKHWTPLIHSCNQGVSECTRLLLRDPRVMVNESDTLGTTALGRLAHGDRVESLRWAVVSQRDFLLEKAGGLAKVNPFLERWISNPRQVTEESFGDLGIIGNSFLSSDRLPALPFDLTLSCSPLSTEFEMTPPRQLTWTQYENEVLDNPAILLQLAYPEALFDAVRDNNLTLVKKLLLSHKELPVNWRNPANNDWTSLHMACDRGFVRHVQLLLAHPHIDVNVQTSTESTPLLYACCNGQTEVVRLLLRDGRVMLNKPDAQGKTPLWYATNNGYMEIVQLLLLVGGVSLDVQKEGTYRGKPISPLGIAGQLGHFSIVKLLTTFQAAPTQGKIGIIKELGDHGMLPSLAYDTHTHTHTFLP